MKNRYHVLIICCIIFLSFYVAITHHYFFYSIDLMTHDKPCLGLGQYCSYYTDTDHCYVGSDYLICDTIGDGIGYD